ncbi:hypothetical protein TNCV_946601 [Trichonephila clavipes]|nr:hypothetical protein TNCV_946601 [Trichonephila clavipes]
MNISCFALAVKPYSKVTLFRLQDLGKIIFQQGNERSHASCRVLIYLDTEMVECCPASMFSRSHPQKINNPALLTD